MPDYCCPYHEGLELARDQAELRRQLVEGPTLVELLKDAGEGLAKIERVMVACERVLRVCHYGNPSEFDLPTAMEEFADRFEELAADPDRGEVPDSLCRAYPTLQSVPEAA